MDPSSNSKKPSFWRLLTKERGNFKSEHSTSVTQMKVLAVSNSFFRASSSSSNAELDSNNNELDIAIAKLDAQNKKLESKNAELNVHNQELVATNAELVARIKELEASNTRKDDQKKKIETLNDDLNVCNQKLETLNQELTVRTKDLESSTVELTVRIKELERSNTKLEDKIKELEASNYKLAAQTKELEASNVKLTSQNNESKAANAQLAAATKGYADSIVELDAPAAKEKIKTSNFELFYNDLKAFNEEFDSKIKKVVVLNAELMAGKEKLEAKCSEIATKKDELETQLTKDIEGWKDKFKRILTAHEELKRDLEGMMKQLHIDDLDKFLADEQIWPKDQYETLVTLTSKTSENDTIDKFIQDDQINADDYSKKRRDQHEVVLKKFDNFIAIHLKTSGFFIFCGIAKDPETHEYVYNGFILF
ncbi:hypothetical protein Glove_232g70 [Diversispora epigaea]|uniref:Uncharacterized protein n=1 Tax=Diversispora epigaea TaxID=1348612 RepID=A0A397IE76_9GLOM|nr:hypothetical protein Glove_232g70 [Diversispora epigaea]